MKKIKFFLSDIYYLIVISFSTMLLISASASISFCSETYKIDPVHSSIIFKIDHLGVAPFYGRFNNASGSFIINEKEPGKNFAEVSVVVDDVDTFNEKRDAHLKNEDFFHADKYPTINFRTESFKELEKNKFEVTGQLSFHGVTKPIVIEVRRTGALKDPWGNFRMGFETIFSIRRSEFGMDKMMDLVGDQVDLMIAVEGIMQ